MTASRGRAAVVLAGATSQSPEMDLDGTQSGLLSGRLPIIGTVVPA
jgi:hypothetical protein